MLYHFHDNKIWWFLNILNRFHVCGHQPGNGVGVEGYREMGGGVVEVVGEVGRVCHMACLLNVSTNFYNFEYLLNVTKCKIL